MATSTDRTAFRTITEDGELSHDGAGQAGRTLYDFEVYANTYGDNGVEPGEIAQWYVVTEDGEGDLLAECAASGDVTTYPAAYLFD